MRAARLIFSATAVIGALSPPLTHGQIRERPVPEPAMLREKFQQTFASLSGAKWASQASREDSVKLDEAIVTSRESVGAIFASDLRFPARFLVSMNVDHEALGDLAKWSRSRDPLPQPLLVRVVGASDDLRIKAQFVTKTGTSMLKVAVRTLKPGTNTESNGWFVWYAPFYDDRKQNWERFGPVSSPSTDELPPGTWAIWAERGDKSGPRQKLTLNKERVNPPFDIDAPE